MKQSTQKRKAKERFKKATQLEKEYLRSLQKIVHQIDRLIKFTLNSGMPVVQAQAEIRKALESYSKQIGPWAENKARLIFRTISKFEEEEWMQLGRKLERNLKKEFNNSTIGTAVDLFMSEQVKLIQDIPLGAARRIQNLAENAVITGERPESLIEKIMHTGQVTRSRAQLIARTTIASTATALTKIRSEHVGSTHYTWRTCGDGDVRESHKHMNGKVIAWSAEPEVEPGKFYHAGCFPNCRCWAAPILDQIAWQTSSFRAGKDSADGIAVL